MAEQEKTIPADVEALKQVEEAFLNSKSWLPEFLQPYWQQLQEYPWLLFIVVIAAGYVIAKIVQWVFKKIANYVTSKTTNEFDDKIIAIVSKTVFSVIFFISLMLAVDALIFESTTEKLLKRMVMSILVISVMISSLKGSKIVLQAISHNRKRFSFIEERTLPILNIASQILLIGAFSYFLILLWGKDPTAWLASAGVVGIAVGFAAKDTLANLFAGFFIVADSPYKIGDYIVLDSGERGQVTHVGIRSTRLMTRDDIEITIPNSVMGNAKIVNESGGPSEKTRVRLPVGVAYDTDLDHVVTVLKEEAATNDLVLKYPEPRIRAKAFGASSVDFQLQFWIDKPEFRGRVKHNLILAVHKRFRDEGIEIPYAKQDLYIKRIDEDIS
ncbi:mechanosensitive ion channel family protein [Kangiella sp. HZ709]|uniref:mechanosensitive ion channel family protein n=1 Tax=Kangiella sp. HZ709 TaxID=2666328 RepID=UPI0012AF16B5|nr:mechanosensitive ion channel family protein [Kangiella sp. HZ709]MRX27008.1 mechanosensitive ion channel [Kangiella sp. HZ709]